MSDWLLAKVDRYRRWILLGVLGLYLLAFNGQWRVERDSALYLTIGRNLAQGQGYVFRDRPHHLACPGLPLLFAATFRIFHTDSLLPALVLMFLMGGAALGLTYRLFFLYAGRPTAVMMTVGLALTRLFYRYCFELLTDLPFLLGVMAFLAGYEAIFFRRAFAKRGVTGSIQETPSRASALDWTLLLAGLGLASLMRPTMWALLIAIVPAMAWNALRGKGNWLHIGIVLGLIILAAVVYQLTRAGPSGLDEYEEFAFKNLRHAGTIIPQILKNFLILLQETFTKALFGTKLWLYLNIVLGLFVLGVSVSLFQVRVLWGLWTAITIGMLLLFSSNPLERYFLPVIPLLVFGWWRMLVGLNHLLPLRWGNWLFALLLFSGIGVNIARIGEMIVEQRRVPFVSNYRDGRYETADSVAQLLRSKTLHGGWVLAEPKVGRVMTFLSGANVFETTDAPDARPDFALFGPSWEESGDGRKKELPRETRRKIGDPVRDWLSVHPSLHLGIPVAPPIQGPHERSPWLLYPVEQKPSDGRMNAER